MFFFGEGLVLLLDLLFFLGLSLQEELCVALFLLALGGFFLKVFH